MQRQRGCVKNRGPLVFSRTASGSPLFSHDTRKQSGSGEKGIPWATWQTHVWGCSRLVVVEWADPVRSFLRSRVSSYYSENLPLLWRPRRTTRYCSTPSLNYRSALICIPALRDRPVPSLLAR